MPRVFVVTGTSTGFGNEYVKEILSNGDIAVATARDPSKLSFEGTSSKNYLALPLDVTDASSVEKAFKETISKFGRIDVVVNNAGYGLSGVFESLSEKQARTQMEVNFFGVIEVTRQAMAIMREQKPAGGVIQQVTSIGGQRGVPLFSIYCASKWAIEGFTEALTHEVKPEWNIKFTCIEPGAFRTDWAGRSMQFGEKKAPAYDHIDAKKQMLEDTNGKQPGDPAKAAKAMYKLAYESSPPLRVVVGNDAYEKIMEKLEEYKKNYTKYESLSKSCQIDE